MNPQYSYDVGSAEEGKSDIMAVCTNHHPVTMGANHEDSLVSLCSPHG